MRFMVEVCNVAKQNHKFQFWLITIVCNVLRRLIRPVRSLNYLLQTEQVMYVAYGPVGNAMALSSNISCVCLVSKLS